VHAKSSHSSTITKGTLQPAERRDLSFKWVSVFHRSGEAPPLPRARDTGPGGEGNLWDGARVYCLAPDGGLSALANSRVRAVAERAYNVRREHALLAIYPRDRLDAAGNMVGRSIFADLNEGSEPGITDGLKVDSIRRVYCTGPGGIWVIAPEGRRIGVIRWPQQAVNFAFGGPDLRTLFCCAHSSVYTLRVKVSGIRILVQATRAVISQRDQWRCPKPIGRGAEHPLPPRARTSSSETGVLSANRHGSDEVFGKYFCSAITVVLHWRVPPIAHDW